MSCKVILTPAPSSPGIKSREDVLKLGIPNYNEECRSIVMRYSTEWQETITRLGRWIDFENDYKTMQPSFMESVWCALSSPVGVFAHVDGRSLARRPARWVFKSLWDKGLVYRGYKVRGP